MKLKQIITLPDERIETYTGTQKEVDRLNDRIGRLTAEERDRLRSEGIRRFAFSVGKRGEAGEIDIYRKRLKV